MSAQDAFSFSSRANVNLFFVLEDIVEVATCPEMSFIAQNAGFLWSLLF
jgi:hypothetical protein